MALAIEAVGLVKRFGKTLAVDGVDLAVRPGMVLGLMLGGPVATPAWHSIAWSIAITGVFAPLAVRRYHRIG